MMLGIGDVSTAPARGRWTAWAAVLLGCLIVFSLASPASAQERLRGEGSFSELSGGGPLVLEFSPAGGPVNGSLSYEGNVYCRMSTGETLVVVMYVDLTVSGNLDGTSFSGTLSGNPSYSHYACTGQPIAISIAGIFDFAAGAASGTVGGDASSQWSVQFSQILPPQVAFTVQPERPRPGEKVVLTDRSVEPSGGQLTQAWYVDGAQAGTGPTLSWTAPADGNPHTVKLVVTSSAGVQAELTKTIEPLAYTGRVVENDGSALRPLAGVEVQARVGPAKAIKVTTDGSGNFTLPVPPAETGEVLVHFEQLTLPAGGTLPWLNKPILYPLDESFTYGTQETTTPTLEVPTGTVVLRIAVDGAEANQSEAMPTSVGAQLPGINAYHAFGGAMNRETNEIEVRVLAKGGSGGNTVGIVGGRTFSLDKVGVELLARFDQALSHANYEIFGVGQGERREYELVVLNPRLVEQEVRARVRAALLASLGSAADAEAIATRAANTAVQEGVSSISSPQFLDNTGIIQLPSTLAELLSTTQGRETFEHELFHAFQAQALRDSRSLSVGGEHEIDEPCHPHLAFDEGRAHFFAYLMQTMGRNTATDQTRKDGYASGSYYRLHATDALPSYDEAHLRAVAKQKGVDGKTIENVVTGFLLDFYGDEAEKNPSLVFKDFYETSDAYRRATGNPPATVDEFIDAKRRFSGSLMTTSQPASLGKRDQIGEIAAKYEIWNEASVHLKPPLEITPEMRQTMLDNADLDKEIDISSLSNGFSVRAPVTSRGGTLSMPAPAGKSAGPAVTFAPGTTAEIRSDGVTLPADPSSAGSQRVLIQTGDVPGYSVKYGPILALPDQTRYSVAVEADGTLVLSVLEGQVTLADTEAGQSVVVPAGNEVRARPGELIGKVVAGSGEDWWGGVPGGEALVTPSGSMPGDGAGNAEDYAWFPWLGLGLVAGGGGAFAMRARRQSRFARAQAALAPRAASARGAPVPPPLAVEDLPRSATPAAALPGTAAVAFCYSCGQKLEQGARFCPHCGTAALAHPASGSLPAPSPARAAPAASANKGNDGTLFAVGLLAALFAVAVPLLLFASLALAVVLWRRGARGKAVMLVIALVALPLLGFVVATLVG